MKPTEKIEILFLSKNEVENLVNLEDAVVAAEEAFRILGEGQLVEAHQVLPINGPNITAVFPTYLKSVELYGLKQVSVYKEREPSDNLPSIWGSLIILNHVKNGLPYTIMDGTAITNMRSAGGHAVVAAKYLAKKNPKTLAIIGCGAQGRNGFQSFINTFPIEHVKIYDAYAHALSFYDEIKGQVDVEVEIANSPKDVVANADIILMATTSPKPIIFEPWIEKGCFVAGLMGLQDIDPMLGVKADKWILGNHKSDGQMIIEGKGELASPKEVNKNNVYADMGEIVTGLKSCRKNEEERILYTHMGMGAHDILLSHEAYKNAVKKGLGTKIYL